MESAQSRRWILLGLLLAGHVVNNLGFVVVGSYLREPIQSVILSSYLVLYGVTTSQPVLLAMWAVLARGHLALRISIPALLLALISVIPFLVLGRTLDQWMWDMLPTYLGFQIALFAVFGAVLIVLRALLNWRVVPQEADDRVIAQLCRSKTSLLDLFGITAFVAVCMAALRVYNFHMAGVWWPLTRDMLHGLVALAFLPLLLVAKRPLGACGWLLAALGVDLFISAALVFRGSNAIPFLLSWLAFSFGFFGSVIVSSLVARAAGYRWVRNGEPVVEDKLPGVSP